MGGFASTLAENESKGGMTNKNAEEELSRVQLQAILLACSFTIFRPITLERPNVLLPWVTVSMIEYTLAWLESARVEEVFVFCGTHSKQVIEYLENSNWLSPSFSPFGNAERQFKKGIGTKNATMMRLSVWSTESKVKMRLMVVLADSCKVLKGGAMASVVHMQAQYCDPLVNDFMNRLFRWLCFPLFEMVRSWVLEGELKDIFAEFFLLGQPVEAESLWREGYQLLAAICPTFISQSLVQRILRTGKSINIRDYVEIVFQNWESSVQSWHLDGFSFFVVGMDGGQWIEASRARYNLRDTVARCTTQYYIMFEVLEELLKEYDNVLGHREAIVGAFFGVDKKKNDVSRMYTFSRDGAIFTFGYSSEDYKLDKMKEDSSEPEIPGTPEQRQNAEESNDVKLKKRKDLDANGVEPDEDDGISLFKKKRTMLRNDFFMQAPGKLSTSDYHKGLDMVVVVFSNGVFALYHMPDFVCLHLLSISRVKITTAVFNGLGNWLTFGCAKLGQLLVWEWKLGSYVLKQQGHYFDVNCLAYLSDSQLLATGADDNKIKSGEVICAGKCFATWSYTADGSYILAGGNSKYICMYDIADRELSHFVFILVCLVYLSKKHTINGLKYLCCKFSSLDPRGRGSLICPRVKFSCKQLIKHMKVTTAARERFLEK